MQPILPCVTEQSDFIDYTVLNLYRQAFAHPAPEGRRIVFPVVEEEISGFTRRHDV